MRALVQRTTAARVTIEGAVAGEIGPGLVVFVCAMRGDGEAEVDRLARRVAALRIFRDANGQMNLALKDVGGSALIISQFTLAAETRETARAFRPPRRPSKASGCTNSSSRRCGGWTSRLRPAASAPTWPCRSSTTARSPSGSIPRARLCAACALRGRLQPKARPQAALGVGGQPTGRTGRARQCAEGPDR